MEFQNRIAPDTLENLVDLLNKHLKETRKKNEDIGEYLNYAEDWRRVFLYEIDWAYYDIDECVILSKKYGFIKWLIENDKIDFGKVKRVYKNKRVCNIDNARIDYIAYGKYESLLMLLSIQDNPIEFLISILK